MILLGESMRFLSWRIGTMRLFARFCALSMILEMTFSSIWTPRTLDGMKTACWPLLAWQESFPSPVSALHGGGCSQIACELGLLGAAVARGHYSYYHLLSGQDLPIKSQDQVHLFFDSCGGKEFIRFENHNRCYRRRIGGHVIWNNFGKSKSQVILRKADGILSRLLQCLRNPAKGLKLMKGDNWFSITDGLARYIVESASSIRSVFWDSMCGDELFLQTFAWNADKQFDFYRMPGEGNADGIMRLIKWGEGESPRVFSIDDLDLIRDSRMMFARKFDFGFDSDIVRAVEKMVC